MPTFGSLFSGIGGIDLGLERAGWECRWQVEIDPFCTAVLERHWPDITRYGDIRAVRWADVEPVELVCGGFPCQPVSVAGRQKAQKDERWLWPEFARAVRGLRPRWVLVENVPGLLSVNGGTAADEVFGDLARLGFDAEWACIPAAAVGAPHLRYRVFVTAHAQRLELRHEPGWRDGTGRTDASVAGDDGPKRPVAHAVSSGLEVGGLEPAGDELPTVERGGPGGGAGPVADAHPGRRPGWAGIFRSGGGPQPADRGGESRAMADPGGVRCGEGPGIFGGLGLAECGRWEPEPDVGRVAHGVPRRVDRLRALGNAVVPAVAEWVGRRMMEADRAG